MTENDVSLCFRRRLAGAFALLFALLTASGAWQALSAHDPLRLLVVLAVFGGLSAAFAWQALHGAPVLLIDDEGVTDLRGGTLVRWQDIESAHVAERRSAFERYHELVLMMRREQTLKLSLDQLTRRWSEVAELVEGRLGRPVTVERAR